MMKQTGVAVAIMLGVLACGPLPVHEGSTRVEGSYDTTTRYDFSSGAGALTQTAGAWVKPETAIGDAIIDQIRRTYGSHTSSTISSLYGATLQSDIRSYLASEAPSWVLGMSENLNLVDEQMKTVDVQSSWVVVEKSGGQFEVTQIWNGIAVFSDPACRAGGGLICDQIHISSGTLLDAEYPLEILSTRATALAMGNALHMDSHSVEFNYGRLGLYLLVNLILPDQPTEGVGMRDLALAAINCRGLAGRLAGEDDVLGWDIAGVRVGLSLNELIGNCEEGVFGSVNRFVDRFNLPLQMDLTGNANLVDTTRDGQINRLDHGHVSGNMNLSGVLQNNSSGPVRGEFTGFRAGSW